MVCDSVFFTVTILFMCFSLPRNYEADNCSQNLKLWFVLNFINCYVGQVLFLINRMAYFSVKTRFFLYLFLFWLYMPYLLVGTVVTNAMM